MSYWIEKYKPKNIIDYENEDYKNLFYEFKNIKNLLIYGKTGTGKTTFINILLNNYLLKGQDDDDLLILNASDERGINTVRTKIKTFCKKKINKNQFKIIILDECDSLTIDAQMSMRKIVEDYKNTKFIFICNYDNKIIQPLISRCVLVHFKNFSPDYIMRKSLYILKNENILNENNKKIYKSYISKLIEYSENDIRRVINNLQYLTIMKLKKYDENILNNIYGLISKDLIKKILANLKNMLNIKDTVKLLSFYNLDNIINIILDIVVDDKNIEDEKKINFINILSYIDSIKNKNIDYEIIIYKILKEYNELKFN